MAGGRIISRFLEKETGVRPDAVRLEILGVGLGLTLRVDWPDKRWSSTRSDIDLESETNPFRRLVIGQVEWRKAHPVDE